MPDPVPSTTRTQMTTIAEVARAGTDALELLARLDNAERYAVGSLVISGITLGRSAWLSSDRAEVDRFLSLFEERCFVKKPLNFSRGDCYDESIAYASGMASCEKKTGKEKQLCELEVEVKSGGRLIECQMRLINEVRVERPRPPGPQPRPFLIALVVLTVLVVVVIFVALAKPPMEFLPKL